MTISHSVALQLKESGLKWKPQLHDFFMVPEVDMDDRSFVIGDMLATIEVLQGHKAITFNGAVEWALDFVLESEAVWLPSEAQMRSLLQSKLPADAKIALISSAETHTVELAFAEEPLLFSAESAEDAYAKAYLSVL